MHFVSEPKMKAKKSIIGSAFMIDSYIYEELKLKSTGARENKKKYLEQVEEKTTCSFFN